MKFFDDEVADKPVYEEIDVRVAKVSPFAWADSIYQHNYMMTADNEKDYSSYMVNRALSMGEDTVAVANAMNGRTHLDRKLQYDFLINIVRARKRFNKWIKAETVDAVEVIKTYYGYSTDKAVQVLPLLSDADIEIMKKRTRKGGLNG